ncbi:LINE-1 type transposase domain-containing protein 1 [Anabarilius grahami]|uniref:LINE-1 type transposase domain-containing protein 1 n=1 Tax=Anabarilius grahami TaxID=495550 RepID=A0A3N0Y8E9_ANAGA|nr:LINE-1 type transposase domain-containing protein 1 [Anabarilius grahami]
MDEKAEMRNEEIRKQISGLRDELKGAIDQANIKANVLEERTAGLETAANTHSDAIANLEQQVAELKKEVVSLAAKAEDLEARSRRCNLSIFGVKEGREAGVSASTFIAKLLQKVMGLDKPHVIDRANTLQQAPGAGQPLRAFVVKCHYYQEKESILRKAVTSPKLVSENGDIIRVYLDYTQNVARQWAAFGQARQLLRQCEGVKCGLLYPAKLRITTRDGQQKSFTDPEKAVTFVRGLMSD